MTFSAVEIWRECAVTFYHLVVQLLDYWLMLCCGQKVERERERQSSIMITIIVWVTWHTDTWYVAHPFHIDSLFLLYINLPYLLIMHASRYVVLVFFSFNWLQATKQSFCFSLFIVGFWCSLHGYHEIWHVQIFPFLFLHSELGGSPFHFSCICTAESVRYSL
jgi:hypothetical protein